jgi:hypothetical protein
MWEDDIALMRESISEQPEESADVREPVEFLLFLRTRGSR